MTWNDDLLTFVLYQDGVEHSPQRRKLSIVGGQLTDDNVNKRTILHIGNTNDWKGSVRVATTADLSATRTGNTLTASGNGNINTLGGIDGITDLKVGDLILAKNEAAAADNGIWKLTGLGSPTTLWTADRATLADESAEVTPGLTTYVEEGDVNGRTTWLLKTTSVTLNTTALEFECMAVVAAASITSADHPYTMSLGQRVVLANSTGGVITVNLPPAADWKHGMVWVKDSAGQAAVNNITIDGDGVEFIDGAATYIISTAWRGVALYSDGAKIFVLNRGS